MVTLCFTKQKNKKNVTRILKEVEMAHSHICTLKQIYRYTRKTDRKR